MTELTLIGAPTDVGASVLGASMGPDALRIAGIARPAGPGPCGAGPGQFERPGNPQAAPQGGFRHLVEVTCWNEAVFAATLSALQAGGCRC
jgi:arginase